MLGQRIVTAVVLLLVLLPALFYPSPEPFCALAMLFVAAAVWEWARLSGYGQTACVATALISLALAALGWGAGVLDQRLDALWLAAVLVWAICGGWLLRGGPVRWQRLPKGVRLAVGVVVLWVAWLAVAQARMMGVNFLLSVLVLVWVADIGAYFAGRGFGGRLIRRKLAPSISPGKTWEGALGGAAGVLLLAWSWHWVEHGMGVDATSFHSQPVGGHVGLMVLALVLLAGMSVVGDLVESLVKRAAGAKDSSRLLPGHGGVLDRIDALLPVLPMALWLHGL